MSTFRLTPSYIYIYFHTPAPLSQLQAEHNQSHTKLDMITVHNEEKKSNNNKKTKKKGPLLFLKNLSIRSFKAGRGISSFYAIEKKKVARTRKPVKTVSQRCRVAVLSADYPGETWKVAMNESHQRLETRLSPCSDASRSLGKHIKEATKFGFAIQGTTAAL